MVLVCGIIEPLKLSLFFMPRATKGKAAKTVVKTSVTTGTAVAMLFLSASAAFAAAAFTKVPFKSLAPKDAPAKQVVDVKPVEATIQKMDPSRLPDLSFYDGKPAAVSFVNHTQLRIAVVYANKGASVALPDASHRSIDVGYQFLNKQKAPLSVPIFLVGHAQLDVNAPQDMNVVVPVAVDAPIQDAMYLRIVLDTENAVLESNEDNNTMTVVLGSRPVLVLASPPVVRLSASSPGGGSSVPGIGDVLRFTVTNPNSTQIGLSALTFKVLSTDNAHTLWNTNSGKLGNRDSWSLYDSELGYNTRLTPSDNIQLFTPGGSLLESNGVVGFAHMVFQESIYIEGNQTKTFVLRVDTTGASIPEGDVVRFDITQENAATLNSSLYQLPEFQWEDMANRHFNNDGTGVRYLPVVGGTLHY